MLPYKNFMFIYECFGVIFDPIEYHSKYIIHYIFTTYNNITKSNGIFLDTFTFDRGRLEMIFLDNFLENWSLAFLKVIVIGYAEISIEI